MFFVQLKLDRPLESFHNSETSRHDKIFSYQAERVEISNRVIALTNATHMFCEKIVKLHKRLIFDIDYIEYIEEL